MRRKKRVVAFGVFDLLHPGHLSFLQKASKLGNELIVVITRDSRVLDEKGRRPVFNEKERVRMLENLIMVNRAIMGEAKGKWSMLNKLEPDCIALGHDQKIPASMKQRWTFRRIAAYKPKRYKTSRIRDALA